MQMRVNIQGIPVDIKFNCRRHSPLYVAMTTCKAFSAQNPSLMQNVPEALVDLTADCVFPLINHLEKYYTVSQLVYAKRISEYSTRVDSRSAKEFQDGGMSVDVANGRTALRYLGYASLINSDREHRKNDFLTETLRIELAHEVIYLLGSPCYTIVLIVMQKMESFALVHRAGELIRVADIAKGCSFNTECTERIVQYIEYYERNSKLATSHYLSVRRKQLPKGLVRHFLYKSIILVSVNLFNLLYIFQSLVAVVVPLLPGTGMFTYYELDPGMDDLEKLIMDRCIGAHGYNHEISVADCVASSKQAIDDASTTRNMTVRKYVQLLSRCNDFCCAVVCCNFWPRSCFIV